MLEGEARWCQGGREGTKKGQRNEVEVRIRMGMEKKIGRERRQNSKHTVKRKRTMAVTLVVIGLL